MAEMADATVTTTFQLGSCIAKLKTYYQTGKSNVKSCVYKLSRIDPNDPSLLPDCLQITYKQYTWCSEMNFSLL